MPKQTTSISYCFVDTQVQREDITCAHAAFAAVDPEALLAVLLRTRLGWRLDPRLLTGAAKRHLLKKTSSMLSLMYDIEPVPLAHPSRVIIPVQAFSCPGKENAIERTVSAAVLRLPEAEGKPDEALDYATSISDCVSPHEGSWCQDAVHSVDGLIGAPWTEVLGMALWLPSSLTEYERVSGLAHLFWVMGFSGFAEAVHEVRTVHLHRHPDDAHIAPEVALCFQEQECKMDLIADLLNHNSMVDVQHAAEGLGRILAA